MQTKQKLTLKKHVVSHMDLISILKKLNNLFHCRTMILICVGIISTSAIAAGNTAPQIVKQNCGTCHGVDGNSVVPVYPKLASQVPQYIEKQLHDFTSGARSNPIMSDMAKTLSTKQIQQLAQFFSQQKSKTTAQEDTPLIAQGEKIYHGGVNATNTPACAACHGATAIGLPPLYPRLAGQHAAYVESQLLAFQNRKRNNDAHAVMRDIASKLTSQEIKAVSVYLGSLP